MKTPKLLEAIDKATEAQAERDGDQEFRTHLGASVIGHDCARYVWYSFRWTNKEEAPPRMLRLWQRGHRSEKEVFEHWLQAAGVEVYTEDATTGEQFLITDFGGHFGGSLDGVCSNVPDMPDTWMLTEFKTHNEKSFKDLVKKGVKTSKPRHLAQMTIYMGYRGLSHALYGAVNKNNDELYFEIVEFNPALFQRYKMRADNAINSETPLDKISTSAAWYQCKFCEFSEQCHKGADPVKTCRTCQHVVIDTTDGTWKCGKQKNKTLTKQEQLDACDKYKLDPNFKK